jgi:hypothetical protein
MLPPNCHTAGYNAPAKIELRNRCGWIPDLFADASFTYWYAAQDGMTLATSADLVTVTSGSEDESSIIFNLGSVPLVQSFEFTPGFKVGIGCGIGESEVRADYTWFRQKTSVNSNAPRNKTGGGTLLPVWLVTDWFAQGIGQFNELVSGTNVSSSWHLGIDQIDLTGGRPYYLSRNMTVSPYGGVRAMWIRQSLQVAAMVPAAAVFTTVQATVLSPEPIYSRNHSNSWGVGPVFGASGHCLLGDGFRLEGNGGFSLLFTQYTTLSHSEDAAVQGIVPPVFSIRQENYNTVRPMANLGLGLGWGSYLQNRNYHLDFSADYEFSALWNQNMMRTLIEEWSLGNQVTNDLFLQGLTVTGRFDF